MLTPFEKPALDWVNIDRLVEFAVARFQKSADMVLADARATTRVEPTLAILRSGLTGTSLLDSDTLDLSISLTKTMQNAVGLFHQDVLGAAAGWASTGTSGGAIDLKGVSPVTGKYIVAETKMRFNTIKGANEKDMWDSLKQAAVVTGEGTLGYIFQIIPKTTEAYDRAWKVSGRTPDERVRCADGVTAYHLVTGVPDALFQLLEAMPYLTAQVAARVFGTSANVERAFLNSREEYSRIISKALPRASAHAE